MDAWRRNVVLETLESAKRELDCVRIMLDGPPPCGDDMGDVDMEAARCALSEAASAMVEARKRYMAWAVRWVRR